MNPMTTTAMPFDINTDRYARCIETSKRIRWDIERDVIRGRQFDFERTFMPAALSRIDELRFLSRRDARFLSQVQGRTYANMFALVERFIGAKVLEISREHWLGDQVALEALVRLADEELKHQELFRRLEAMAATGMPEGYVFRPEPNEVASAVLSKSTWAVLALTLDIELFSQAHYRASIEPDPELSPLWREVFLFHWKEESQHAILDELEWRRADAQVTPAEREQGVDRPDRARGRGRRASAMCRLRRTRTTSSRMPTARFSADEMARIRDVLVKAYRWQYIVTGATEPRFAEVLTALTTPAQMGAHRRGTGPHRGARGALIAGTRRAITRRP